jgi:hypothetical protein
MEHQEAFFYDMVTSCLPTEDFFQNLVACNQHSYQRLGQDDCLIYKLIAHRKFPLSLLYVSLYQHSWKKPLRTDNSLSMVRIRLMKRIVNSGSASECKIGMLRDRSRDKIGYLQRYQIMSSSEIGWNSRKLTRRGEKILLPAIPEEYQALWNRLDRPINNKNNVKLQFTYSLGFYPQKNLSLNFRNLCFRDINAVDGSYEEFISHIKTWPDLFKGEVVLWSRERLSSIEGPPISTEHGTRRQGVENE